MEYNKARKKMIKSNGEMRLEYIKAQITHKQVFGWHDWDDNYSDYWSSDSWSDSHG